MNQAEQLELLLGKITQVRGGQAAPDGRLVYTTQSTSYDISASIPNSFVVHYFSNQVPETRLWPADQELDAVRLLNTVCIGVKSGLDIMWIFYEPPMVAPCPNQNQPLLAPGRLPFGSSDIQTPGGNLDTGSPDGGPGAGGADAASSPGGI